MIDHLHMPSFFLASTVFQILSAVMMVATFHIYGREAAVKHWTLGYICFAFSSLVYAIARGELNVPAIVLGNGFAMAGATFLLTGTARFFQQILPLRTLVAFSLFCLSWIIVFKLVFDSTGLRNLAFTAYTVVCHLMTVKCLLAARQTFNIHLRYIIALSFTCLTAALLWRASALLPASSTAAINESNLAQSVWMITVQLTTFISLFGFLLLINSRISQDLYNLAYFDPLTGALVRNEFEQRARKLADKNRDRPGFLLVMDLDDFKSINDTLGHDAGDQALKQFAGCLRKLTSDDMTLIARAGGDEFWLLSPGNETDATELASRICNAVKEIPVGKNNTLSTSIGISSFLMQALLDDLNKVFMPADHALYAAKTAGRATFRIYNENNTTMA